MAVYAGAPQPSDSRYAPAYGPEICPVMFSLTSSNLSQYKLCLKARLRAFTYSQVLLETNLLKTGSFVSLSGSVFCFPLAPSAFIMHLWDNSIRNLFYSTTWSTNLLADELLL